MCHRRCQGLQGMVQNWSLRSFLTSFMKTVIGLNLLWKNLILILEDNSSFSCLNNEKVCLFGLMIEEKTAPEKH